MKKIISILLSSFFTVGSIVFAIIIYLVFIRTTAVYESYVPYKELVKEVAVSSANAHLWLEEWVAGDASVNYERSIDGQLRGAKRMLTSAYYTKGNYTIEENQKLKSLIKKCMNNIDDFIVLTQSRKELVLIKKNRTRMQNDEDEAENSVGTEMETNYDYAYEDLLIQLANLSDYILEIEQEQTDENKSKFLKTFVLIAIFFSVSVFLEVLARVRAIRKSKIERDKLTFEMNRIEKLTTFIDEISNGKYDAALELNVENDHISKSILNLREILKDNAEEEKKRLLLNKQQNWISTGLSKLGDIIHQSSGNLEELSSLIIKSLVNYIEANQGGIFIVNDEERSNSELDLAAAFAYGRKKYLKKKVNFGEGLVGACAIEKETIYMTEVPDNYIEITSGLGTANPNTLLIVPLKLEDRIFGVIEIASFNLMPTYVISFVEQIAESIASTLSTVRTNARTAKLLKLTQMQSEEKASQEEELRQNMEEMQSIQEESERKKQELIGLINAIDHTTIRAEFDLNGDLLVANDNYCKLVAFNAKELLNKNVIDFISEDEKKNFDRVWGQVCADKQHRELVRRKNKYDEYFWLIIAYIPIKDPTGDISKILFLATDITSQKELEISSQDIANELKEKESQLIKGRALLQESNKRVIQMELKLKSSLEDLAEQEKQSNKRRRELEVQDEILKIKSEDLESLKLALQKKEKELNQLIKKNS